MPVSLLDLKVDLQLCALLLVAAYCWRRGAAPERACASVLLAMKLVDWLYHWGSGKGAIVAKIDVGHFAIDLAAGVCLWALAVRANRTYPIGLAALQVIAVAGHFARNLSPGIIGNVYALMTIAPSYLLIAGLQLGAWRHARRHRKWGTYPSWLGSLSLSPAIGLNA